MKILFFIAVYLIMFSTAMTYAGEYRRFGQGGIRNLGMGNTGVALSYDENALYYNPAGLAGTDAFIAKAPLLFELSEDIADLAAEIQALNDPAVSDLLAVGLNKNIHFRTMISPYILSSVVVPFDVVTFGLQTGVEFQFDFSASNPILIELDLGLRLDQMQTVGLGFQLGDGHWLVGVGSHSLSRCDVQLHFSLGSLVELGSDPQVSDLVPDCASEGIGVNTSNLKLTGTSSASSYDFGFQRRLEAASALRITLAAVAQNIGGLNFDRAADDTLPVDEPTEISLGMAIQPKVDSLRFLYEIDIRDITFSRVEEETPCGCMEKRLHLGGEIGFLPIDSASSFIALRFGLNQGYWTAGFELNPFVVWRILTIQYATYGVETGDNPGDKPERRHVLEFSFSL